MKNIEAVKAYQALEKIKTQPMDIITGFKLLQLQKKLKSIYDSYVEMEFKMIDKYHLQDKMDGNRIRFDTDEAGQEVAKEYYKEHLALDQMEAELPEIKPIAIQGNIQLSIADLQALEAFIDMPEMEDDANA